MRSLRDDDHRMQLTPSRIGIITIAPDVFGILSCLLKFPSDIRSQGRCLGIRLGKDTGK